MKRFLMILCTALVLSVLVCGCGGTDTDGSAASESSSETVSLNEEDLSLLEEMGDDITVVSYDDFAETVSSFDESYVGQVFQLTGYYLVAESEDEEVDCLSDSTGTDDLTSVMLRYLSDDLVVGNVYTVTGIVALEEHDDHSHIVLDVVTVESYSGN